MEGKPTKNQHQNSQKLSTNFLQGTPKRVLPKDSHYFLLAPINPFKGTCFDLSLTLFETRNLQKTSKTNRKRLQKFSTSFLIGVQKRVLPRDSHYFLLGPIKGGILALFGERLVRVWKVFWEENRPKTNTKTSPKTFY